MKRFICELPIGPFRIALFEMPGPIMVEGNEVLAAWLPDDEEIVILESLRGTRRWAILLHELFHALCGLYDLDIDEEHVCTTLGNGLAQALARYLPDPPEASESIEVKPTASQTKVTPRLMDDEKTPTVGITPRSVAPPWNSKS